MTTRKRWLLPLLCLSALQGCAYLHTPTKEALGKDVKDAWEKVDLHAPVEVARTNYEGIHTRQLANLDELKSVTRDALILRASLGYSRTVEQEIASLQGSMGIRPTTMPCEVDAKTQLCVMDDQKFRTPYVNAKKALQNAKDLWTSRNDAVRLYVDTPLPSCEAWQAVDGKAKKPWLDLVKENAGLLGELGSDAGGVTKVCAEWTTAQTTLTNLLKASVGATPRASQEEALYAPATIPSQMETVEKIQTALDNLKTQAAEAAVAVAKAKKSGDAADAEEAKDPKSTTALAKLQDAATKFSDAADKVIKASDQFPNNPFLKDLALTLQSETLTAYFKNVKDAKEGEDPRATSGKAAAVSILFANYFDATSKRFKAAEGYGLATLALQEQLVALEQQRTKRQISVLEQQLKLAQQKLQVLIAALDGYLTADAYLSKVLSQYPGMNFHDALLGKPTFKHQCPKTVLEADPCYMKKEILVAVPSDSRTDLWLGLGTYIQASVTYPSQFRQLTESEFALDRADRMVASELNLQVWDAVLAANVNQLQTWSSFGVTKDDFQKAINNVLTGLIAVGVLK